MVKLFYLAVLHKRPNGGVVTCLRSASDLSSFGFFQRGRVSEFMQFTAKMVVERTEPGTRLSVNEREYVCHAYVRLDQLAAVLVSDQEYPHRVGHSLLTRILDEFAEKVPTSQWYTLDELRAPYDKLDQYLAQFQNPKQADAMSRIENDLDETKIVLHKAITSLLERGEKLDNLVAKSEDLSSASKVFYKTARKTNQCCQYY